jgi:hypothetical protein
VGLMCHRLGWRETNRGNLVYTRIRSLQYACRWASDVMAWFKQVGNCNGTGVVSSIVMAFFKKCDIYNGIDLIKP